MNIYEKKQWWKIVLLLSAVVIGAGSLYYTNKLVKSIAEDERKKIELWAEATRLLANPDPEDKNLLFFTLKVIEDNTQIPVILTDDEGSIMAFRNLDTARVKQDEYLLKSLSKMKEENDSISIYVGDDEYQYLYYRNSNLLRKLAIFPYVQLAVIVLFILVSYLAFSVSRKKEQNEVWTGLSKETAHQLGTPISSLAGWLELLKESKADDNICNELEKDTKRLEKIADRFSKIGSRPALHERDIIAVVKGSLEYILSRRGKSVEFSVDLPDEEVMIPMNSSLIDWVIENLCKNAMDATEGKGKISLRCSTTSELVIIEVEDNGKGIAKSKFNTVFKPGYTTKKRGWGLGLSLSKRIVEEYHHGKIFVLSSEPGVRTVFRIVLKRRLSVVSGQ